MNPIVRRIQRQFGILRNMLFHIPRNPGLKPQYPRPREEHPGGIPNIATVRQSAEDSRLGRRGPQSQCPLVAPSQRRGGHGGRGEGLGRTTIEHLFLVVRLEVIPDLFPSHDNDVGLRSVIVGAGDLLGYWTSYVDLSQFVPVLVSVRGLTGHRALPRQPRGMLHQAAQPVWKIVVPSGLSVVGIPPYLGRTSELRIAHKFIERRRSLQHDHGTI
mmetsp:Transcript_34877/g.59255  ORF Transcript_34877/g.59255 Transcript_34877/m.59255 type:complete len:215 (-) Transcript_34877:148-792(-)